MATQGNSNKLNELRFIDPASGKFRVDFKNSDQLLFLIQQLTELSELRVQVNELEGAFGHQEAHDEFYARFADLDHKVGFDKLMATIVETPPDLNEHTQAYAHIMELLDKLAMCTTKDDMDVKSVKSNKSSSKPAHWYDVRQA